MEKRDISLDILKGFLIILVVLGHAIQDSTDFEESYLWNFIYSFHMPLFIMVSGYLTKNKSLNFYGIEKRFKQLVVPYIVWSFFLILKRGDYLYELENIILYPDNSYWFLYVLFIDFCILTFVKKNIDFLGVKEVVLVHLVAAISLSLLMILTEFRLLGLQFICWYYLFFLIGYLYRIYEDYINKFIKYTFLLFPFFVIGGLTCRQKEIPFFLEIIHLPSTLLLYSYRFMVALVAILFLFPLFKQHFIDVHSKILLFLSSLGRRSLGIYVVHLFIGKIFVKLLKPFFHTNFSLVCIDFILLLLVSYCVTVLIAENKHVSKYLLGK